MLVSHCERYTQERLDAIIIHYTQTVAGDYFELGGS